jgi:hypothetical protein
MLSDGMDICVLGLQLCHASEKYDILINAGLTIPCKARVDGPFHRWGSKYE